MICPHDGKATKDRDATIVKLNNTIDKRDTTISKLHDTILQLGGKLAGTRTAEKKGSDVCMKSDQEDSAEEEEEEVVPINYHLTKVHNCDI